MKRRYNSRLTAKRAQSRQIKGSGVFYGSERVSDYVVPLLCQHASALVCLTQKSPDNGVEYG